MVRIKDPSAPEVHVRLLVVMNAGKLPAVVALEPLDLSATERRRIAAGLPKIESES